jgi:hypothetical protein
MSGGTICAKLTWMPSSPSGSWRAIAAEIAVPPVAALGDVAGISESLHQHRPCACDAIGVPAGGGGLAGEPVARQRRDHHIECVRRASPVFGGISGSAPSCGDLTWMKWMATLSISVMNCGSAFSFPSHARQSYSLAQ